MISSSDNPDQDDNPEEFLRYLLRRTGGQVTAEVVAAARERFSIPRSTLFRLAARFRKTQRTSSLRPRKRGTHEGAVRLDPRTERIIAEQVDGFWLKKEKPSLAALLRRIREVCLTEGLSPPHRSTVQARSSTDDQPQHRRGEHAGASDYLTSRPTERRIYGQLLMAMGASINERLTLMELEIRTVLLLKSNNVRVLVFDEVHNLLAGTPREQRVILQLLRYLSNEIKASLVCLGVSEARDAIAGDTQLARRLDQFVLPRWKADEEFQELVTAILRSLPLRLPSSLSSQSLRHLSRLGDGITARVFGILNELAIEAIQNGIERITDDSIESWRPALEKEAAFA